LTSCAGNKICSREINMSMKAPFIWGLLLFFSATAWAQNLDSIGRLTYPGQILSSIWGYTTPDGREFALVGTSKGTSIVDISNPSSPVQVHFINGAEGTWREIKTYRHYAYIVHDNSIVSEGVLIVDLKNVGDNVTVKDFRGSDGNLRRAHALYTDSLGYLYLFGGTLGGCAIFDIKADPTNPIYIGLTSSEYIHDGYVRGDTLWASNVFAGSVSVWDLSDRSLPVKIASFNTPMNFTHNAWLSDDGQTLFTTDEKSGASVAAYNVSDVSDVDLLDEWKLSPGETSIPHNVHVVNDYLVISHYTEGVVICDALDPRKIITVGRFDTSPRFTGGGFFGCWGVYPYFPSGLIIASDMEEGLFILRPNYIRGVRALGTVTDAVSGRPINRANIQFLETGETTSTNFDGQFSLGRLGTGFFTLRAEAQGYAFQEFRRLYVRGSIFSFDIALQPLPLGQSDQKKADWVSFSTELNLLMVQLKSKTPARLSIFDNAGALAKEITVLFPGIHSIDWSNLSQGLYVVHISTDDQHYTQKLFKK
jgi:choice-of-anchor B domain-containing protein